MRTLLATCMVMFGLLVAGCAAETSGDSNPGSQGVGQDSQALQSESGEAESVNALGCTPGQRRKRVDGCCGNSTRFQHEFCTGAGIWESTGVTCEGSCRQ
ncbi:hypothetical protein LZC95_14510 [Pendulispora brunnea]|uniref:Kazal-like domain-containing protein n=1 Tax=Pendulispora brunnea TaxID=2905690 RepID=A0ABZ2KH95_9BACT